MAPEVVAGNALDDRGNPFCSEMWPGNTADVASLFPVAARLKERFGIEGICIVADRGMISETTIAALEAMKWEYILGARMCRCHEEHRRAVRDRRGEGARRRTLRWEMSTAH
jgi:transposase